MEAAIWKFLLCSKVHGMMQIDDGRFHIIFVKQILLLQRKHDGR